MRKFNTNVIAIMGTLSFKIAIMGTLSFNIAIRFYNNIHYDQEYTAIISRVHVNFNLNKTEYQII